jgi:hypothetical protein
MRSVPRRSLPAALAILAAAAVLSAPARAGEPFVGLFTDAYGNACNATIQVFQPVIVHVLTDLSGSSVTSITAAEFRIENWPGNPGYPVGQVTERWDSNLVIGRLAEGFSIAFQEPVSGPLLHLGELELMAFDDGWIGADRLLHVAPALDSGSLVVVDEAYEEIPARGGWFLFNGTSEVDCEGGMSEELRWGQVKSLYDD